MSLSLPHGYTATPAFLVENRAIKLTREVEHELGAGAKTMLHCGTGKVSIWTGTIDRSSPHLIIIDGFWISRPSGTSAIKLGDFQTLNPEFRIHWPENHTSVMKPKEIFVEFVGRAPMAPASTSAASTRSPTAPGVGPAFRAIRVKLREVEDLLLEIEAQEAGEMLDDAGREEAWSEESDDGGFGGLVSVQPQLLWATIQSVRAKNPALHGKAIATACLELLCGRHRSLTASEERVVATMIASGGPYTHHSVQ